MESDLFAEAEQSKVEEWTEEIVAEIIGAETVKKWRY
jgi:hypothetical protein